ncbi:hypothetical protein T11_12996 [Trichinella zimbabwensis]|uniref:Uncharacterized protein n=1 Tax=Trichinella zimbabwensis TaxID=268475 RepID=A0A0V1G723_9BILA|nr:hypothetical protein T11_12996 [Trichinella zimbabwensis]
MSLVTIVQSKLVFLLDVNFFLFKFLGCCLLVTISTFQSLFSCQFFT